MSTSINLNQKSRNTKQQQFITNHHRSSLQLINPSASPYVSLTPSLILSPHDQQQTHQKLSSSSSSKNHLFRSSPINNNPSSFSTRSNLLGLTPSTSQHTLKTLSPAAPRYYDEYDEDDEPSQTSKPNPKPASFPPPCSSSSSLSSSTSSTSSTSSSSSPKNYSSVCKPLIVHPTQKQSTHHSKVHSLLPCSPERPYNRSSTMTIPSDHSFFHPLRFNSWNRLMIERPLLALALRLLALVLGSALIVGGLVWFILPPVAEKDLPSLRIPTSFEALKKLNTLLQVYKTENYHRVLSSFVLIYLFLQAFSLPGSMYLSILAGAMFGVQVALPLVCLCVGTGAMLCYLMSYTLASTLVLHIPSLRDRLDQWKIQLSTKTNKFDLFSYLILIRISPLPPHWVVNLLAPHVGIQLGIFWLTTCLGILPVTLIHTQLGTTLDQMVGPDELSFLNTKNLSGLGLVAIGVMAPVLIRWYLKKKDTPDLPSSSLSTTTTAESRPYSNRIGLSLDDDREGLGRPNRLRSLSCQTYEHIPSSSSITSLSDLSRVDSTETLLLSSSHRPVRPPQSTRLSSSSTTHLHHSITMDRAENVKRQGKPGRHHHHLIQVRARSKEDDLDEEDDNLDLEDESLDEIQIKTTKKQKNFKPPHLIMTRPYSSSQSGSDLSSNSLLTHSTPRPSLPHHPSRPSRTSLQLHHVSTSSGLRQHT